MIPLLDLKAQYASIRDEIDAAVARVIGEQRFVLGPEVSALEDEIARYSQCEYGVGVSSGTDAILASLMALGVGPGDEIVTTPYTFVATVSSILRLGAKPVLVDIDARTSNLDVTLVAAAITAKTKAILPVHLFGQCADMTALSALAGPIPIIEDAAQAIGAEHHGRRAGSLGKVGCFSFFPSKNLGAFGDGGMVVTNDRAIAERLVMLRNHGQAPKYRTQFVGGNFRLDALQAAVLRVKLRYLAGWTAARRANAERYALLLREAGVAIGRDDLANGKAGVCLPIELPENTHVYNQLVLRTRRRDELRAFLTARAIGTEIYYPEPLHLQPCFDGWGFRRGQFPEAERAAAESLAIPVYPELGAATQQTIVDAIAVFFRNPRAGGG